MTVQVEMVDIQVRPYLDVTLPKVREYLLSKISTGQYYAVLLSPPCSTFSRATWANRKGPRPVRSFVFPRGFKRLTWSERKRADWGNVLADFSFLAFAAQADTEGLALFENPEDLGAVKSGENQGNRPSSMWQWLDFDTLLKRRASQQRLFTNKILGQSTSNRQDFYSASLGSCPHFFCKGNHSLMTRDTTWDRCSREQQ